MESSELQQKGSRRNGLLFALLMIALHILAALMYGFYFRTTITVLNMSSALTAVLLALTSLAGTLLNIQDLVFFSRI